MILQSKKQNLVARSSAEAEFRANGVRYANSYGLRSSLRILELRRRKYEALL